MEKFDDGPKKKKRRGDDPELDALMDELAKETGDPLFWDVRATDRKTQAVPGVIIAGGADMAKAHVGGVAPPRSVEPTGPRGAEVAKRVVVAPEADPRNEVTVRRAYAGRTAQEKAGARGRVAVLAAAAVLALLLAVRLGFYLAHKEAAGSFMPGSSEGAREAQGAREADKPRETATASAMSPTSAEESTNDTSTSTSTSTATSSHAAVAASATSSPASAATSMSTAGEPAMSTTGGSAASPATRATAGAGAPQKHTPAGTRGAPTLPPDAARATSTSTSTAPPKAPSPGPGDEPGFVE